MQVLHVTKVFIDEQAGGVQRSITALSRATRGRPIGHRLLTLADDGPWERDDPQNNLTVRAEKRSGKFMHTDFSLRAHRVIAKEAGEADVIHYHLPWPFAQWLDQAVPANTPRVATYHADICRSPMVTRLYQPLMMRFLKSLEAVMATSPVYCQTSPVLRQLSAKKLHVAELGLDIDQVDQASLDQQRQHYAEVLGTGFLLFLGTTRYYKGAHVAIDALAHSQARLVIAGDSPDRAALQARAKALGVDDQLIFLGRVSDPAKWALLDLSAGVVLPSILRAEAFGLVLLEAAAASRAAITCEIGTATSHIVRDGETGYVVEPRDSVALAEAMERLVTDPAQAAIMGNNARRHYDKHFTAGAYAERVLAVYEQVTGQVLGDSMAQPGIQQGGIA